VTGPGAILAVDGGNSKVDLLLVARDGHILGAGRGETVSHQQVGLGAGMTRLDGLARELAREVGVGGDPPGSGARAPVAAVGAFCLAGADSPRDIRQLRAGLDATGLVETAIVRNDTLAALRAGASRPWGVAVICGQGVNAIAMGIDGRKAGFAAVGSFSGDWGGGTSLGEAALGAAVRAGDGRGPATSLARLVPEQFGRRSAAAIVRDLYVGRLDQARLSELAPTVFAAAVHGDAVARTIVDRLADELAVMVAALVRRTHLRRRAPEVVLAGGVFRNEDDAFYRRLDAAVQVAAPGARLTRLGMPPVVGAALIGLDALELPASEAAAAEARLRAEGAVLYTEKGFVNAIRRAEALNAE